MHTFDQDVSLKRKDAISYSGHVTENWSINGIPNGGYLMAILSNAMMHSSSMHATPVITANFLNRCDPDDVEVSIDQMVISKQFARFQAQLHQKGKEKIRAFGTFANASNACVLERCEASAPEISALEKCVSVPGLPTYTLFDQLDIRLDPNAAGWMSGELSDKSEIKGWVKFNDERPFDVLALLLIADSFPPAVLASQGMVAWVPTIEFSVNVRKIPTTKWLKCILRTRFITCGLLEEDGEIWDQSGELVAITRQIAQYRAHTQ